MSKISSRVLEANVISLNCELISNQDISFLEGKLKTFVESLGLNPTQEKAAKDIVKGIIWDWYTFIRDHKTDHLREKKEWYENSNRLKNN